MPHIFLLEDDLPLGSALQRSLHRAGFTAHWLRCVVESRNHLPQADYAALILDLGLPDGNGFELLDWLRRSGDSTPVLILTARSDVNDRVRALDAGADDYLSKPFAVTELISRLHALIRRRAGHAAPVWQIGALQIEPTRQQAHYEDRMLDLSPKEYRLLLELARQAGQVVSRARLETAVFRAPEHIESNLLEVHMHNLRRKLGASLIRTIRGVGYVLQA
jgi:DNA-binding response OmpR family regulator